jgi:hypothetical protein
MVVVLLLAPFTVPDARAVQPVIAIEATSAVASSNEPTVQEIRRIVVLLANVVRHSLVE